MNLADLIRCTVLTPAMLAMTRRHAGVDGSGSVSPAWCYLPKLSKNKTHARQ